MTEYQKNIVRGLRNCNPLNIVLNVHNNWVGRIEPSQNTDGTFEQFRSTKYGIRAAMIILTRYVKRKDVGFYIPAIIHRWAPDGGDVEKNYIKFVTNKMATLNMQQSRQDLKKLVSAMSLFESRYPISDFMFEKSFDELPYEYRIFWR